jgi:C-terminal peptidase prc
MPALLFAAALGLLAPGPAALPPSSPVGEEAHEYAKQLLNLTEKISTDYIRAVDRKELLAAALAGLYEAARKPVPPRLRAALEKAGEDELHHLIAQAREQAGAAEALRGHQALLVSMRALSRVLDPYAVVYDLEASRRTTEPDQTGPGLTLEEGAGVPRPLRNGEMMRALGPDRPGVLLSDAGRGPWRVATVTPGGPAQRAGLRTGDRITHIDGRPLAEGNTGPLAQRLFGGASDARPVRVTFRRGSEPDAREAELVPGAFTQETVWGVRRLDGGGWDYFFDRPRKVALVRIGPITKRTPQELDHALAALQAAGAKAILLDLRACPGGYLAEATEVVRRFVTAGVIATVKNRDGRVTNQYEAGGSALGEPTCTLPLVVLSGTETVGGGELIAAGLQDLGRARVAGQRSAGKAGVMQDPMELPVPGMVFKLSTQMFVRSSGKRLQRYADSTPRDEWGVMPDAGLAVPLTPELAKQVQEWWRWQTLRPAGSREALPLDDPQNDPVAQAAVRALGR